MLSLLAGHELTVDEAIGDHQILIDYAALLVGNLSACADVESRMIVK